MKNYLFSMWKKGYFYLFQIISNPTKKKKFQVLCKISLMMPINTRVVGLLILTTTKLLHYSDELCAWAYVCKSIILLAAFASKFQKGVDKKNNSIYSDENNNYINYNNTFFTNIRETNKNVWYWIRVWKHLIKTTFRPHTNATTIHINFSTLSLNIN